MAWKKKSSPSRVGGEHETPPAPPSSSSVPEPEKRIKAVDLDTANLEARLAKKKADREAKDKAS